MTEKDQKTKNERKNQTDKKTSLSSENKMDYICIYKGSTLPHNEEETEGWKMLASVEKEESKNNHINGNDPGRVAGLLTVLSYIGSSRARWAKVGERSAATLMYSLSREGSPVSLSCSR